jgi:hypothetical protein
MQHTILYTASNTADENNIINYVVTNPFYLFAPSYYYNYYSTYLRNCLRYYDGNVNVKVGKNTITNSLSLQSIARGITNKLFANGIDFIGSNGARNKIIDWAENTADFEKVVKIWRKGEITAVEAMKRLGMKSSTFYNKVKAYEK